MRLMLTLLLLFPLAVQAQAKQPIDITANKLDVNQKAGTATFSGDVRAVQGTTILTSNALSASYASNAIQELRATGNVRFNRTVGGTQETATGASAVYKPGTEVLTMSGGVTLTRAGNTLRGNTLTYNIRSGQVNLGGGGRVTGQFQSSGGSPLPTIKTGPGTSISRSVNFTD